MVRLQYSCVQTCLSDPTPIDEKRQLTASTPIHFWGTHVAMDVDSRMLRRLDLQKTCGLLAAKYFSKRFPDVPTTRGLKALFPLKLK